MTCAALKDAILFYAAGVAEPDEKARIEAHLRTGCPVCVGRLAEAEATLAPLPLTLPGVAPSPGVRERLMKRVAEDAPARRSAGERRRFAARSAEGASAAPDPGWAPQARTSADRREDLEPAMRPRRPARSFFPALAAATLAAVLGGLAVYIPMRKQEATLAGVLNRQDSRLRALEEKVHSATLTVKMLRSPAVQVVSLGPAATPGASGRIFWDRRRGEWRFYAADLAKPAPGRTYELWFITEDQRKIPAGTFDVNEAGEGELIAHVPTGERLALAAVTDEPSGGAPQPTGKIHIAGPLPPAPAAAS